jgi:hypothetical protein
MVLGVLRTIFVLRFRFALPWRGGPIKFFETFEIELRMSGGKQCAKFGAEGIIIAEFDNF